MRFQDKVVLITGAARGIGLSCAEVFAREGARLMLVDIDEAGVQEAASRIAKETGVATHFAACDLGDSAQTRAVVPATLDHFGVVDVLVNNAGILAAGTILDLSEEDFDRVMRINLKAYFLLGQAVARAMVESGTAGAIVNMASVNSVLTIPNHLAYTVSKGGVAQLTKVMALALAPHNIRVNAIGPGSIMTDMMREVLVDDEARRMILSRIPLGRFGEPIEVATIVLFLASDDASYITGQLIHPDGGRLALNYTVPVAD